MKIASLRSTKTFEKQLGQLPDRKRARVVEALRLLLENSNDRALRPHQLKGQYDGTYSISAGGDLRIHFEMTVVNGAEVADIQEVGTHSQFYG
jgi:mRNA-degrading endonuclease YafQ of YafQ-DinJ toxin-antitoxin module